MEGKKKGKRGRLAAHRGIRRGFLLFLLPHLGGRKKRGKREKFLNVLPPL